MYKYETHLHTFPVSRCGRVGVAENLEFYKSAGYDGVFITNHFLDGNINCDPDDSYEDRINFFCSDYEEAVEIGKTLGLKVFFGAEITYGGTDFLVYGLDKEWFLAHPEIMEMKRKDELAFMAAHGALIIQAHPYREADYIDHIRLFPRSVHGVEVINACCSDSVNKMAQLYAENYQLLSFAGSDNHSGAQQRKLAGVCCSEPVRDVGDFIQKVKSGVMEIFCCDNE